VEDTRSTSVASVQSSKLEQSTDDYSSVQLTLSSINGNSTVAYHSISSVTGFHLSSNVGDHHLISGVGTHPHSSGVGDQHHSTGIFPLSKYKVGGSDDKRITSFELSFVEDRKQKKTKSTIAASIDSVNDDDDEFAPADLDAAIAASIDYNNDDEFTRDL